MPTITIRSTITVALEIPRTTECTLFPATTIKTQSPIRVKFQNTKVTKCQL